MSMKLFWASALIVLLILITAMREGAVFPLG
jgi:hypothetical protein